MGYEAPNEHVRARSMALSYVLEHLVATKLIGLDESKEYADKFYEYIVQDIGKATPEGKTSTTGGTKSASGGGKEMTPSQWSLFQSIKGFTGGDIEISRKVLKFITAFKSSRGESAGKVIAFDSVKACSDKVAQIAIDSIKKLVDKGCTKKARSCDHSEWEGDVCFCKVLTGKQCAFDDTPKETTQPPTELEPF